MQFRHTRIDIEKTRANWPAGEFKPALVLPRENRENYVWHIVDGPVNLQNFEPFTWAVAAGDEYIRIPLFLYEAPAHGDLALTVMFKLGLFCGNLTQQQIKFAHVVTGNPAELVYNADGTAAHIEFWMGAAFIFEE